MTIKTDIDEAIDEEAIKRANGKRPKPTAALVMGGEAIDALRRQGHTGPYRGYPIVLTDQFVGWELRC